MKAFDLYVWQIIRNGSNTLMEIYDKISVSIIAENGFVGILTWNVSIYFHIF